MVISEVSIKRPVFATVLSLLLVVLGIASFLKLPVREYPKIDTPIVSITTVYTGASNEVIESRITQPIENAVSGLEGVKRINSTSREERSQVNIEFQLSRDIEAAASDVRDRIGRIISRLPDGVDTPVIGKVDSDSTPVVWFTLFSDSLNQLQLTDYARRNLVDRLAIVPGVASVNIAGERRYSMRIWLDRQALAARSLTVDDVDSAIRRQNIELPSGRLESSQREFTLKTDSRLKDPAEFSAIVISNRAGYPIRLGEVAQVEVAPEDSRSDMIVNGRASVGVSVTRQSTANTLEVADGAKAEMTRFKPSMPPEIDYIIGYDESIFVQQSLNEVYHALAIGMVLVVAVIFVFLRSASATLIPAVAIPVAIIGTFTVMQGFGFSINVLTLLAYVLAVGIVVDDAIVVLENIHRRIEEGEPPLLAALRGSRQIAFAVVATTATLTAVFVPLSFMDGNTGRLFAEFGIALASAVIFSGLIALTLTPMLCSKLLRTHEQEGWFYIVTEAVFSALINGFRAALTFALKAPSLVLVVGLIVSAMSYNLWSVLPKEFAPTEDRATFNVSINGPEGSSMPYMREQAKRVEQLLMPLVNNGLADVVMINIAPGFQRPAPVNNAFAYIKLKPWQDRTRKQQEIVAEIFPKLAAIPGVRATAVNPGSLGQRGFGQPVQFIMGGPDYETLRDWRDRMFEKMRTDPRLLNPDSNYRENKPELRIKIDRAKASDLGVGIDSIGKTLQAMFGSRNINTYVDRGQEYNVILQAREQDRATPSDLTNMFVRSTTTQQLIPLSNLVSFVEAAGPQDLNRVDRVRTITMQASLAPGFTLAEALEEMQAFGAEVLPPDARISYGGQSRDFKDSSNTLYVTFLLALVVVFLVLAAQFESWIHPLIIMLAVPLAVTGGLFALFVAGMSLNIYSQIGMILLVGLMAKNGILIVEFSNQLRDEGASVRDAVLNATVIRLRPILMTSIATVFGAVPLAFGSGAGSESRSAIGMVIIGGIIVATTFTLFVIPALYVMLARFTQPINTIAKKLAGMETDHVAAPEPHGAPAE